MKKVIVFLSVFLLTFLLGYFVVPQFMTKVEEPQVSESVQNDVPIIQIVEPKIKVPQTKTTDKEAEIVYQETNGHKYKVQLLKTGEFWSEEVTMKSGETWLGFFKEGDNYSLKPTKVEIRKNNEKGKTVSVDEKNQPLFLLKKAAKLKSGKIETVLDGSGEENEISMHNGFSQDFDFGGEKYSLDVENETGNKGSLDKGSRLLLTKGEKTQVLATVKNGCNDCFWYLNWVGDLDQDGKLDFYLDLSNHYNTIDHTLFLSSESKSGKLVGKVAEFWISGC
jgi:hypothetical protein